MRFVSFRHNGLDSYGVVKDGGVIDLGAVNKSYPRLQDALAVGQLEKLGEAAAGRAADFSLEEIKFLAPVTAPSKILCVGINYPERAAEYEKVVVETSFPNTFIRTTESLAPHRGPLIRPLISPQLDYESEVVLVIGKAGRYIEPKDAMKHVAGITIGNEGTIRDWTRHGARNSAGGKNFYHSGSIGPWIDTAAHRAGQGLSLKAWVNGELRQDGNTADLLYPFEAIIEYMSKFATLRPGDLIFTGTPPGTGAKFKPPRFLQPGDIYRVEVENVGVLENTVADEVAGRFE